jgi:streptomycin 3"-adenylyltransferase
MTLLLRSSLVVAPVQTAAARETHRMNDEDRRQLDLVVALVREVLGAELAGAYLFGSAVLGGLRPESDLDVLAVSRRPTTRQEKRLLAHGLLDLTKRPRHVEVTVVVRAEAPARIDFQYGDWLRPEFERGNLEPWEPRADRDLPTLLAMTLAAGVALAGPPPAEVLDPVPHDELVRAMAGDVGSLLDDLDSDTRNVVLTLARIWSSLATGELRSKDAAADWALERLPEQHRAVLARARAIYLGDEHERWDDLRPQLRPHAGAVAAEIARLAGERPAPGTRLPRSAADRGYSRS